MNQRLKNYLLASAVAFVALAMHGCYYDNAEDLYPATTCEETIEFSTDVATVISTNCATPGCHVSGTGRVPLTTHAEISAAASANNLGGRVESGSMPPSGALESSEITAISCWIEQGSTNN